MNINQIKIKILEKINNIDQIISVLELPEYEREEKLKLLNSEKIILESTIKILDEYGIPNKNVNKNVNKKENEFDNKIMPITIEQMIIYILNEFENGADIHTIINIIRERWRPEISRISVAPILSRLKKDHKIVLDEKLWKLSK